MDAYQVRTWHGWHHHMALSLLAVWFLIGATHRGQQLTPALTLPQVPRRLAPSILFLARGTRHAERTLRAQRRRRGAEKGLWNAYPSTLLSLNLLAFLFHTVLEWSDEKYALLSQVLARRQTFFEDIRALTRMALP